MKITRENSYDGCSSEHPFLVFSFPDRFSHLNQPFLHCLSLNIISSSPCLQELFRAKASRVFFLLHSCYSACAAPEHHAKTKDRQR